MDKKIGFIGTGNMSSAIIGGLVNSKVVPATAIYAINRTPKKAEKLSNSLGIYVVKDVEQLVKHSDILIVGVKPKDMAETLLKAEPFLKKETLIVSIAAGVTLESLAKSVGAERKIVRVMPNTPALVGEGMSSITPNSLVSEAELELVKTIFSSFGRVEVVSENLIHAVTGVSGSSPAYVFMMIEAMADAAVLGGMSHAHAYTFAAQAVLGSAKMVLESGMHVGELKDMICSPAGTTIEAVCTLENKGFRSAIIEAVKSCMAKSELMSKKN